MIARKRALEVRFERAEFSCGDHVFATNERDDIVWPEEWLVRTNRGNHDERGKERKEGFHGETGLGRRIH
jgi:hypothetical protein